MKFSERIIKDPELLNKFLNKIGFEYDKSKNHMIVEGKNGFYIFCSKIEDEILLPSSISSLYMLAGVMRGPYFDVMMNSGLVFLNDIGCYSSDETMQLNNDKTKEWLDFLVGVYGYKFVNNYNKKVDACNKKKAQKNENSRTF